MKRSNLCIIWLLVILLLFQNTEIFALTPKGSNTAPVANFTIEKNRNVKLMVLSDYAGTEMANLKNSITSMKSELTNDAKIDIEYVTPTDTQIGIQKGFFKMNTWGMMAHGDYRRTGVDVGYDKYNIETHHNSSNYELVEFTFSYSPEISLPEGESPNVKYNVPDRYTKTVSEYEVSPSGLTTSQRFIYDFYDKSNAKCYNNFSIGIYTEMYYTSGGRRYIEYKVDKEPEFTYDTGWSIESSKDTAIDNTVLGWDLSKINYSVADNTDTYVVFAMNNEDTNYYKTHPNTYKLGQLRSDANLGKYIKDSQARVYSICSDNLENVNLSTNPKYPITFTSTQNKQNASVKDLINESFDGRSLGAKNLNGLVNKIKENVKKPSNGNIDMIVTTDKDALSTNNFINSIKNNVSADVDVKTNVVDKSTLEDTSIWTKYVLNGKYKNITSECDDVILILTDNGELWAYGSNYIGAMRYSYKDRYGDTCYDSKEIFGLFGLSSTVKEYSSFVKICTNVKDAILINMYQSRTLVVLKNDGTVMCCGRHGWMYDKNDNFMDTYYSQFTALQGVNSVESITMRLPGYGMTNINFICKTGSVFSYNFDTGEGWELSIPYNYSSTSIPLQYICYGKDANSGRDATFYIFKDMSICSVTSDGRKSYLSNKIPSPIKEITVHGLIYCEDNNIYSIGENVKKVNTVSVKQSLINNCYYLDTNSELHILVSNNSGATIYEYNNIYSYKNIEKVLFVKGGSFIAKDLNGNIGYKGEVSTSFYSLNYSDLLCLSNNDMSDIDARRTADGDSTYIYNAKNQRIELGDLHYFNIGFKDMIADYFQLGNYFAYIKKNGDIAYQTGKEVYNNGDYAGIEFTVNNLGKFDAILRSYPDTVKAFTKSKILNTTLREGSERYFIYVSDNIKKETYFSTTPDYFLFGNLDGTILNYLKANNFNIYVVTPQQALDLKLQYPYVPTNIQQYTLRDLVNNATKDSSICKNTNEVVSLISRKYSMYAKQGSTTLTLLVDEEAMNYNLVYRDFENDPKYADRWKYTHDETYFDNPNGVASYSDQWLSTPAYSFSKVGKYTVVSQFRDNPKNVSSFDPYRLWSNISAPATVIVHRRPIASFNTHIVSKVGTTVNLSYIDYSYDLDHNVTRIDKGIAARSWQYRKQGTETWIDGKPTNLTYNTGVYQIRLKVRDIEGAWSKPYIDTIDTANLIPTIDASPIEYNGAGPIKILITASDHGEDDLVLASSTYSPKTRYALTFSSTKPSSGWTDLPSKTYTLPTITTAGTYYLHTEAYDNSGQSFYIVRGPYTIGLPPTIDASPTTFNGFGPLNIIITASDNGENDLVLTGSSYSPKTRYALTYSEIKPLSGWKDLSTKVYNLPSITTVGTYYLHMEAYDTSGQSFYRVRGPYTVETLKASHLYITMMLDVGWRSYYFDVDNGIDDNHDGKIDRYPKRINTDIGTLKMPINYFNLVGHTRTYIKAGYKVKGKIDITGNPDWAKFNINYIKEGKTYTDTVSLTKSTGDTYTFEWIIPLETDTKTFVSFDLITKKGDKTYGNEKWLDTWDERNTSRLVFYVKGKATDDIIYVQSQ